MKRLVQKMVPVLSVAVLGVAGVASAGSTSESSYCYKNTDGSGGCYGTLLGFRNSTGSSSNYARFYKNTSASRSFYAYYTSSTTTAPTSYTCTPDATVSTIWDKAIRARGYFNIQWNASGSCTYLYLANGSQYTNF